MPPRLGVETPQLEIGSRLTWKVRPRMKSSLLAEAPGGGSVQEMQER